ncbi:MAG: DUF5103 domain-containing protein [Bacteroidetes bacterium]|nr:MAG: DUF5103 domain-containing protein [Bacteroidota bacterium]
MNGRLRFFTLIFCTGLALPPLLAQDKELLARDMVYESNIYTVQLYPGEQEAAFPLIFLDQKSTLTLEFDELLPEDQRETDFSVDLIHCDARWEPDNVLPIEFYEGFTDDRITFFQRSAFTKVPYVHYAYAFPQEEEYFKLSGNYILYVYKGNDRDDIVLSRRFVVVESRIRVGLKYQLNNSLERQQITDLDFEINTMGMQIFNPAVDLNVQLLQNFRWDNAATLRNARFAGDQRYEYNVKVNTLFGAGNEFRRHEVTSTRLYSQSVQDIEEREYMFDAFLFPDEVRKANTYAARRDWNGAYLISSMDWPDPDLQSDYVRCHFFLTAAAPFPNGDLYLMGRFTDWQISPRYRMDYSTAFRRYQGEVLMKMGTYDYQYVFVEKGATRSNESVVEGPIANTENFYTVLIYYRAPGDRSDRVIGYLPVNYRQ